MSISKINFTASLLNNPQNIQTQQVKQEEAKAVENKEQTEEQEVNADETQAASEETENHTVRNWSIGLGAAATLIGLGVAGRKGHLGKGIQKLLGGTEKAVEKSGAEAGTKAGEKIGTEAGSGIHTETSVDEISLEEFERIKNKETDFVFGGTKPKTPAAEENIKPTEIKSEEVTPTPKVEEQPKITEVKPTISRAEADAINAQIDKTMPELTSEILTIKTPTLQEVIDKGFDLSKFELKGVPNGSKELILNGKKYELDYDGSGNIKKVWKYDKDGYWEEHITISDGKIFSYGTKKDNKQIYFDDKGNLDRVIQYIELPKGTYKYHYDELGRLERITVHGEDYRIILKDIEFIPGTSKIERITYGNYWHNSEEALKVEVYDGMPKPVKEIYIKDGKEYSEIAG